MLLYIFKPFMQAKQDEAHPLGDKDQEQLQNFNIDTISNH